MRRLNAMGAACLTVSLAVAAAAQQTAPQVMGTVATKDALVTGGLEVKGDHARLMNNTSITASGQTADVKLDRGGDVLVCATSQLHLLHSGSGKALLFGLDRGAMELHSQAEQRDVILTPDIRFTIEVKGGYDLGLRVTRNGDTCVENAGKKAPVLMLNDAFSQASYRIMPGQHVLFEHGNLREVVDHEKSPCGCPAGKSDVAAEQLAANASPADKASAEHPFPAAESEGLAAQPPVENSPVGEKQTQISTTFAYGDGQGPPPSTLAPGETAAAAQNPPPPAEPAPPVSHKRQRSLGARLRHLLYRIFHPAQ